MKLSVIMCAYNVEPFIERAIESIIAQTYQDWELIISDDCSTDRTVEIVEKYLGDPRIRLYAHKKNMGYVRNKNLAFTYASGELLTQLDADDTSPADRFEKQVSVFLRHPEIMICGSNFQQVNLSDEPIFSNAHEQDLLIKETTEDYPFWFPGLMFRKEVIDEFGLFSEYFSGIYGDDNYWAIRVNRKYPIYFLKDILYNYRINPQSLTNVHDNPRKMIVSEIVHELAKQQRQSGTDWLEQGKPELMEAFERRLLNDKKLISEKYREWAAKAIDKKDLKKARIFLRKAFLLNKSNKTIYRTLLYYIQQRTFGYLKVKSN